MRGPLFVKGLLRSGSLTLFAFVDSFLSPLPQGHEKHESGAQVQAERGRLCRLYGCRNAGLPVIFCGNSSRIRVLAGDNVLVEMTPYDFTKGRITYRFK